MNIASLPKDMRNIARDAADQGWKIEQLKGSSHIRFTPPEDIGGEPIIISHTVGDSRAITSMKTQLRRAGLMSASDFKRKKDNARKVQRLIETRYTPAKLRSQAQGRRALDGAFEPEPRRNGLPVLEDGGSSSYMDAADVVSHATEEQLAAIGLWMAECQVYNNEEPIIDCECGWKSRSGDVLEVALHRHRCDRKPAVQIETRPDKDDRLDCGECDFWCWISQPHLMAEHLREKHYKAACPHCKKVMLMSSLDRHISEDCPTVKALAEERRIAEAAAAEEARLAETYPLAFPEPENRDAALDLGLGVEADPDFDPYAVPEPVPDAADRASSAIHAASHSIIEHAQEQICESKREVSESELFALLEIVLDGPIHLTQESFGAVNDWMDATRRLMEIKGRQ